MSEWFEVRSVNEVVDAYFLHECDGTPPCPLSGQHIPIATLDEAREVAREARGSYPVEPIVIVRVLEEAVETVPAAGNP